jgi:hypothetical protein
MPVRERRHRLGLEPTSHTPLSCASINLPARVKAIGVLVVTPINGHIFGQPGRKSSEAVRRLCLQGPRDMDDRAALLVPDRGLDARSYPLVVEVLDGVPSGMWALCQGVFDNVGPYDDWVEDPAVGLIPA